MYYATSYFVLIKRINLIQLFFKLLGQVILKQKQKGSIKELTQTAILYILYNIVIFIFSKTQLIFFPLLMITFLKLFTTSKNMHCAFQK